MNIDEHIKETPSVSRTILIFAVFMAIAYLGIGIFFILKPYLFAYFSPNAIRLFGLLITVYGIYRAYRVYKMYF